MLLVIDANVIFSALVNKGNVFKIFELNKTLNMFEFVMPEYLFKELVNKIDILLLQSKLSKEEIAEIFSFIKKQINPLSSLSFLDKLFEAIELNSKDSPYLALALKLDCGIFSGDKGLKKQSKVKVFSPRELLDMLEKEMKKLKEDSSESNKK